MRLGLLYFLVCLLCVPVAISQVQITAKAAFFNEYGVSSTGVYGLAPVANISKRAYYKIWKPDIATAKVEQYDAAGVVTDTEVYRFNRGSISQETQTDEWGNTYEVDKYTPAGPGQTLVLAMRNGRNTMLPAKQARYIYKLNQLVEIDYLSADQKPLNNSVGVASIRYKRVTLPACFGRVLEMAFFDVNGLPVMSSALDAHKVVYTYDARCNTTSQAYYGTEEEPLTNRLGGFTIRYEYDASDRQTLNQTIGLNGELTRNAYGTAQARTEYTDGFATRIVRMDTEGHPARMTQAGDGLAIIHRKYDEKGNMIEVSYFDEAEKPINSNGGFQTIKYVYSPNRVALRSDVFDLKGAPAVDIDGIHTYEWISDDKGRTIQESFMDKAGQPMKDGTNQVFMLKFKYDDAGRRYSTSYWKDAETKMERWEGSHEHIAVFDADGRVIETSTFDKDGKLFVTKAGYSRATTTYDSLGHVAEYRYFNDKSPIAVGASMVSGYHILKYTYDTSGRISAVSYHGINGDPVDVAIQLEGQVYHDQKLEFLYKGNTLMEERFYKAGNVSPEMVLDCLKHDHVLTSGITLGHKNQ